MVGWDWGVKDSIGCIGIIVFTLGIVFFLGFVARGC